VGFNPAFPCTSVFLDWFSFDPQAASPNSSPLPLIGLMRSAIFRAHLPWAFGCLHPASTFRAFPGPSLCTFVTTGPFSPHRHIDLFPHCPTACGEVPLFNLLLSLRFLEVRSLASERYLFLFFPPGFFLDGFRCMVDRNGRLGWTFQFWPSLILPSVLTVSPKVHSLIADPTDLHWILSHRLRTRKVPFFSLSCLPLFFTLPAPGRQWPR